MVRNVRRSTKRERSYPIDQCWLYKVSSPAMLAERLGVPLTELESLAAGKSNYKFWYKVKDNGKRRLIEEPKPNLQKLHYKVHIALSKVHLPDYVHSIRKGRSYITNARAHLNGEEMVKLDVEKFYRNARSGAVFAFWFEKMQCRKDVAGLLTKLLTFDGHLPTGSSSSPMLSYFAYRPMFDTIAALASKRSLVLTLYVDDMVISGRGAHRGVLAEVRRIVAAHGLRSHKDHYFSKSVAKTVTGLMVTSGGLKLPYARQRRIKEGYDRLHAANSPAQKLEVLTSLGSLLHEAAQIDQRNRPKAVELDSLRKRLTHMLRKATY